MTQDRRTFLKRAAGVTGAAAVGGSLGLTGCSPDADTPARSRLDQALLLAVADAALPVGALGPEGTQRAVTDFTAWIDAFEPVAELDHPYLTDELLYGPAHPGPRWQADLEALDIEARRRLGVPFQELDRQGRGDLLARAISDDVPEDGRLPSPARARHVAVGLMAWFYSTSAANDLGYEARIGRHDCRGIASLPDEPPALEAES